MFVFLFLCDINDCFTLGTRLLYGNNQLSNVFGQRIVATFKKLQMNLKLTLIVWFTGFLLQLFTGVIIMISPCSFFFFFFF